MSPLTDMVAGAWGFAVAPIECLAMSLKGLMQSRGGCLLHEKVCLVEKGITASVPAALPVDIPQPAANANLQVFHSARLVRVCAFQ
jgi:hypothetical protein